MDGIYFCDEQIKTKKLQIFSEVNCFWQSGSSVKSSVSLLPFLLRFGPAQLFSPGMKNC